MTLNDIFKRALRDIINSTSTEMLSAAKKYYDLFERKCFNDGVDPQVINFYSWAVEVVYRAKKQELN